MQKIYIVEDEEQIAASLTSYLTKWGYQVKAATDFQQVLADVQTYKPDLILLDISLPYYNGFYWCAEIRKTATTPIVFLSSADDNMNILMAMNMGADDFVSKPFNLEILVAKLQAILRRSLPQTEELTKALLTYDAFTLFLDEYCVVKGQTRINLTPNETKILSVLFQNPETIVTKELIMEKLWESEAFIDANTLAVNMTRLRKKIAPIGLDQWIQTQKGRGYTLSLEEGT